TLRSGRLRRRQFAVEPCMHAALVQVRVGLPVRHRIILHCQTSHAAREAAIRTPRPTAGALAPGWFPLNPATTPVPPQSPDSPALPPSSEERSGRAPPAAPALHEQVRPAPPAPHRAALLAAPAPARVPQLQEARGVCGAAPPCVLHPSRGWLPRRTARSVRCSTDPA